ncbi:hypothetical protein KX505_26195 [Escherichia coli]|nr:hypothetical protein [Escherichia coli]OTC93772.1 hypothetical protein AW089_27250 [Escherichia coli]
MFSHPVYLFLRKFSLQDFRGGSFSKDAAGGAESGLAAQHYQSFVEQLGIKQGADRALSARKKVFNGGGV